MPNVTINDVYLTPAGFTFRYFALNPHDFILNSRYSGVPVPPPFRVSPSGPRQPRRLHFQKKKHVLKRYGKRVSNDGITYELGSKNRTDWRVGVSGQAFFASSARVVTRCPPIGKHEKKEKCRIYNETRHVSYIHKLTGCHEMPSFRKKKK